MPAPAAPTDLTLTPDDPRSAIVTLGWDHTGTNLDRFQILYRKAGSSTFKNLIVAPKADFGTGPYEFTTVTGQGFRWKVVALNNIGQRSSTNPTVDHTELIDGVWLVPLSRSGVAYPNKAAYLRADSPNHDLDLESAMFDAPFDVEGFQSSGVLHLPRGTVDGAIIDRFGDTAAEWKERLTNLIRGHKQYGKIMLASTRDFASIAFTSGPSYSTHEEIQFAWRASVQYRELRR